MKPIKEVEFEDVDVSGDHLPIKYEPMYERLSQSIDFMKFNKNHSSLISVELLRAILR